MAAVIARLTIIAPARSESQTADTACVRAGDRNSVTSASHRDHTHFHGLDRSCTKAETDSGSSRFLQMVAPTYRTTKRMEMKSIVTIAGSQLRPFSERHTEVSSKSGILFLYIAGSGIYIHLTA